MSVEDKIKELLEASQQEVSEKATALELALNQSQ